MTRNRSSPIKKHVKLGGKSAPRYPGSAHSQMVAAYRFSICLLRPKWANVDREWEKLLHDGWQCLCSVHKQLKDCVRCYKVMFTLTACYGNLTPPVCQQLFLLMSVIMQKWSSVINSAANWRKSFIVKAVMPWFIITFSFMTTLALYGSYFSQDGTPIRPPIIR